MFTGEVRTAAAHEMARQATDRLSMLESDHSRLVNQVDARFAVLSEFNDWVLNKSEEDWIEITGSYCLVYCLITRYKFYFVLTLNPSCLVRLTFLFKLWPLE